MEGLTSRESYRLWLLKHELVYRNEADALADAHRLALLTAVKGAREDRERLRVSTVNSLNLARNPAARRVRGGSTAIDVLFIGAIVLAVVSVGLTFVTAMGGMFAGGGGVVVLFGLLALTSVVAFAWCDPYRARGEVYYSGTSSTLYLVLAVLWVAVFCFGVIAGRSDVNAYTMPFVVAGGALFAGSAGWALWLWWRGRHQSEITLLPLSTMTEPPGDLLRRLDAGRGLLDRADEPALYAALDEWWQRTAADTDRARPGRIEQVWRIVVQKQFQQTGAQPKDQKMLERALKSGIRATWEERRYDWSPR